MKCALCCVVGGSHMIDNTNRECSNMAYTHTQQLKPLVTHTHTHSTSSLPVCRRCRVLARASSVHLPVGPGSVFCLAVFASVCVSSGCVTVDTIICPYASASDVGVAQTIRRVSVVVFLFVFFLCVRFRIRDKIKCTSGNCCVFEKCAVLPWKLSV